MRGPGLFLPLVVAASLAMAQPPGRSPCVELDLHSALELAATQPSMSRARLAVESAAHELAATSSPLRGTVGVGTEATWSETGLAVSLPVEMSLTWSGLGAGPGAEARALALLALEGAEAAFYETWSAVVVAVVRDYLGGVRAQEAVDLAHAELEVVKRRAEAVAALGSAVAVRPTEIAAVELERERAELILFERRLEQQAALSALGDRLGCTPETLARADTAEMAALAPVAGHATEPGTTTTSMEIDAEASVVAAEIALARASRDSGMSLAVSANGRLVGPVGNLSIGLAFDTVRLAPTATATYLPVGGSNAGNSLGLEMGLNLPIGEAGHATLAAAEARLERAIAALESARADTLAELDRRSRAVELAERRSEYARAVVELRRQELAYTETRQQLGLATDGERESARLAVASAELEASRADDAALLARLELALMRGHVPLRELIQLEAGW